MKYIRFLIVAVFFFIFIQNSWSQSPYKLEMVQLAEDGTDFGIIPFGGKVEERLDKVYLRLVRQKEVEIKGRYFISLFDLLPDGKVTQVLPEKWTDGDLNSITSLSDDTILYKNLQMVFTAPYGKESFLLLFTEMGLRMPEQSRGGYTGQQLTNEDIQWIKQGTPPAFLGTEFFSYQFDFIISPNKEVGSGVGKNKSGVEEYQSKQQFELEEFIQRKKMEEKAAAEERGDKYTSQYLRHRNSIPNENVFSMFPVLTFYEPTEPSYTDAKSRGVSLVANPVNTTAYVVKGSIACMSEIVAVDIWVQPDSGREPAYYHITKFKKAPQSLFFEHQITLLPGNNLLEIHAIAANEYGVKQQLELFCNQNKIVQPGKDIILAMAVNDYKNWPKLKNTLADADAVVESLTSHYGFKTENVIKLYNSNFTQKRVDSVFRKLISTLSANDRIVVYYAGHGYYDSMVDEGYWIPVEGAVIEQDYSSYIANSTINKYIKSLKTSHTLFITDACFSGSYFVEQNRGAEHFTNQMNRLRSRWLLTSGRMESVADDFNNTGHSPFATYLLKYLGQPDTPEFTISALANFVTKTVGSVSDQIPQARPIRNAGDEGGEFVFRYR